MLFVDTRTKLLLVVRFLLVFTPQYGYMHADEFFQATEVTSADILDTNAYKAWEFTSDKPIRSAFFVHLYGFIPFSILKYIGSTPYLRLILPRLAACLSSYIIDIIALEMGGPEALVITASSYISMTYYTRTFSNLTESILFALLIYISLPHGKLVLRRKHREFIPDGTGNGTGKEIIREVLYPVPNVRAQGVQFAPPLVPMPCVNRKAPVAGEAGKLPASLNNSSRLLDYREAPEYYYAALLTLGVFNRLTFLGFALSLVLRRFVSNSITKTLTGFIRLSLYTIPFVAFFVAIDSIYYRGYEAVWQNPLGNIVVTPLNFLLYNSSPKNLANHGIHPRWLHPVVNWPLLFGVHAIFLYTDFYQLIRCRMNIPSKVTFGLLLVPTILLCVFPHQEPRFLAPLLMPFAQRYGIRVLKSPRSRNMWYIFNIILFVFYGLTHQAGVVPTQMFGGYKGKVLFYQTYMPPQHLTSKDQFTIDLGEGDIEVLHAALHEHENGHLVFPSGIESAVSKALQDNYCTVDEETSIWPHISTEHLAETFKQCKYGLKCWLVNGMMLNRVRFHCESF